MKALHHHLHTIKGATANIGYTSAYDLILPLEQACRSGDSSGFPDAVNQLDQMVQSIADWRAGMQ